MDGNTKRSDRVSAAKCSAPLWVGQIDLANPPTRLEGSGETPLGIRYQRARILMRFQAEPLGMLTVDLADGELDIGEVCRTAADVFAADIRAVGCPEWTLPANPLSGQPMPTLSAELAALRKQSLPAVTVVIGTRNRPEQVVECATLILKQDYPSPIEVIIVDNGASSTATADAVRVAFDADERVRYIAEERPGLSRARNIGLTAAQYPITAFLSDDIRVDPMWLLAIARGFARHDDVRCVTGFCPPLYLDTEEQLLFETLMAWGSRQGRQPVLFKFESCDDPVHPYRAGSFANGSNMAFDTETFRSMGGFDELLGPGTKARGGEDLDAPIRVLSGGGLVAYEPAVVGWHADTFADRSFSKHMYTYGLGLTAFLTKHFMAKQTRGAVVSRIRNGLPMLFTAFLERDEVLNQDVPVPVKYHLWQLAGRIAGPFAYLASRRACETTRISK